MATQPISTPEATQNPPVGYTAIVENGQNVGLTTKDWGDIVSEQPAPPPVNVAFPSGNIVQFPDEATAQQHASRVWEQLKYAVMPSVEFLGTKSKAQAKW